MWWEQRSTEDEEQEAQALAEYTHGPQRQPASSAARRKVVSHSQIRGSRSSVTLRDCHKLKLRASLGYRGNTSQCVGSSQLTISDKAKPSRTRTFQGLRKPQKPQRRSWMESGQESKDNQSWCMLGSLHVWTVLRGVARLCSDED